MIVNVTPITDWVLCDDGHGAVATIEFGRIRLDLSQEQLDDLREELEQFYNTVWCHQCEHYRQGSSGPEYGGSCLLKVPGLLPKDYGYVYHVDRMHTCKDATQRTK